MPNKGRFSNKLHYIAPTNLDASENNIKRLVLKNLTLEITKRCPMECLICSSNSCESCYTEFKFSELKKIVNDAKMLGCESIALSGGEPMTYPKIIELCEYLSKKKIKVTIYTCGNIFKNDSIQPIPKNILHKLKEEGCVNKIVFSIHGNEKVHEKITTKKGSFRNLLISVSKAKQLGIDVEFNFVPTKINYKLLKTVVFIAKKIGVPAISILRFVPQGRGKLNRKVLELNFKETLELKNLIQALKVKHKLHIRLGAHYSCLFLNSSTCTAAWEKAVILSDGYVVPCSSMKELWNKNYLSNIKSNIKQTSLPDIWYNSPIFIETRTFLNKISNTFCAQCKNFKNCKGGCPVHRILFYGSIELGPDPLCPNKTIWSLADRFKEVHNFPIT